MPTSRTDPMQVYAEAALQRVLQFPDGASDVEAQLRLLATARAAAPDPALVGREIDRHLLDRIRQQEGAFRDAQKLQAKLSAVVDQITAPPWHIARLIRFLEDCPEPRALVLSGTAQDVVAVHPDVDPRSLHRGDIVYLSSDRNVILKRAGDTGGGGGETVFVERLLPGGRLVVRSRDEELIVDVAEGCDRANLRQGAQARIDRGAWMVLEVVEREAGGQYIVEDVDMSMTRERLGGQCSALDRLFQVLLSALAFPKIAALYGIRGRRGVLLYGPPGNGKTLMARICAAEIRRRTGRRCVFAVVRPGEWLNSYVGETERAIRDCFAALREALGADGMAILFIDEIETIGGQRGRMGNHHHDRFLGTLLAEVDGFRDRGEIAIIAATNRKDMLDPALVDRLCAIDIEVKRPDLRGAREIFNVHLPEQLLFHSNGMPPAETRETMVDLAVTRLYAPNGENQICQIQFRNGSRRTVTARELVSGRMIGQICEVACDRAFERHVAGSSEGLELADMAYAIDEALARMSSTITLHSARSYLDSLPQDMDIVRVEPCEKKVKSIFRYVQPERSHQTESLQ